MLPLPSNVRASPGLRDKCGGLQRFDLESYKQRCKAIREKQARGCRQSVLFATIRKAPQTVATVVDGRRNVGSSDRILLLDVLHDFVEIVGGGSSPAQAHQGCKICFSFLPTSSCSTKSPRAAAAKPTLTASTKCLSSSR